MVEDLNKALKKSQKWKAPGKDKVSNFWFDSNSFNRGNKTRKRIQSRLHKALYTCYSNQMNPKTINL